MRGFLQYRGSDDFAVAVHPDDSTLGIVTLHSGLHLDQFVPAVGADGRYVRYSQGGLPAERWGAQTTLTPFAGRGTLPVCVAVEEMWKGVSPLRLRDNRFSLVLIVFVTAVRGRWLHDAQKITVINLVSEMGLWHFSHLEATRRKKSLIVRFQS